MKVIRNVFSGLMVVGVMVFVVGLLFAQTAAPTPGESDGYLIKRVEHDTRIKLLQDSATALQMINPDLAMRLISIMNKDADESKEQLAEGSAEWIARRDAKIQVYKEAAAAIQVTNPDLAKGLLDLTVPKPKSETQKTVSADTAANSSSKGLTK